MQINLDLKTVAVVVGLLATTAASVGGYYVRGNDIDNLKTAVKEQRADIDDLKTKAAVDGSSLVDVKKDLDEIKSDVKELLQR